jgi:predicted amidohydrolase YtcJ
MAGLLIRGATLGERVCDVRIEGGRVAEIGQDLAGGGPQLEARGGELLPGLIDHHIHLFATAAQARSLVLDEETDFPRAVRDRDRTLAPGSDLRVTGYHESFHGPLDARRLDSLAPDRPVRVQHRTGSLWVLNTRALEMALAEGEALDCVERDAAGRATGRIWRGDAWLRSRFRTAAPSLAPLGRDLARQGVTHITDASVSNDDTAAAMFTEAIRRGDLPQRLMLMSGGPLRRPDDAPWVLGPVKILLDDHDLPPIEAMTKIILDARRQARAVAVHCVAAGELALGLAAFNAAGARPGDRIEHGGIITPEALAEIRRLGLTVVTQPGFIAERGDTYLREVEAGDHANLYRCASLIAAGVRTGGSTDAPYTRPDIWAAIRAAMQRTTRRGAVLGREERLAPRRALALFQSGFADPGAEPRRVARGEPADLALLRASFEDLATEDFAEPVLATVVAGELAWGAERLV